MRLVALFAVFAALGAGAQSSRAIDPVRSHASFSVQHVWVERVRGSVPIVSGSVTLAAGSAIPTAVRAVLDASRVDTGEPDRDRSLESPDFFDAERYPHWTFASARIVPEGNDAFEMDGDLTIHGVTQDERVKVTVGGTPTDPLYHASAQIDRRAFRMATTRLDPAIGGIVDVTLDIALK